MTPPKGDKWISVIEAAQRLGISREAIYAAIEDGRIKASQKTVTRRVWRIHPESLASFQVSKSHQKRARQRKSSSRKLRP
jgi:excisionase family DNA binding protein